MTLANRVVVLTLPLVPRRVLWLVAQRYVAGDDLPAAIEAIRGFAGEGFGTIIDVLGENISSAGEAEAAAREYHRALAALAGVDRHSVVCVKPTHLGLVLDRALCERLLSALCLAAAGQGRRVRFEMEDAPTVDATLAVFGRVRAQHRNLGCVLQSRLFRTEADVAALLAAGPGLNVRLVKGIYIEPKEIAWTEPADISASYVRLARQLLDGGATVAFATHDGALAEGVLALVRERQLDRGEPRQRRYEFQCLMGVRREFAEQMRDAGHHVRIYVPYGRDWHAYSLRRLKRNPAIAMHVARALFRRSSRPADRSPR
jgi:proline dehydrogenase